MIERRCLFKSREELAASLAQDVADELRRSLAAKGKATLAVSGGSTPAAFFTNLSTQVLNWARVTITLVDERQVPFDHARSNAKTVLATLMQNEAAAATFVPLFENPSAVDVPPFNVVVLGMGNDGHTASFFPGGDTLATALDPNTDQKIIAIEAEAAGEPRLTFTLPTLLAANLLCLHIEGKEKAAVLSTAMEDGPEFDLPIRAVIRAKTPLSLYWCM